MNDLLLFASATHRVWILNAFVYCLLLLWKCAPNRLESEDYQEEVCVAIPHSIFQSFSRTLRDDRKTHKRHQCLGHRTEMLQLPSIFDARARMNTEELKMYLWHSRIPRRSHAITNIYDRAFNVSCTHEKTHIDKGWENIIDPT